MLPIDSPKDCEVDELVSNVEIPGPNFLKGEHCNTQSFRVLMLLDRGMCILVRWKFFHFSGRKIHDGMGYQV